jgi:hypothetical protein
MNDGECSQFVRSFVVLSRIRENREVIEDTGLTLPYVQMQDFGVSPD